MDIIRDQLENVVNQLEKMRDVYNRELQKSPPGILINNRNHNKPAFFQAELLPDHKYKRTRLQEGNSMISELARKEYLNRSIKQIDINRKLLASTLKGYASMDPAHIIDGMSRAYRMLDNHAFFYNEEKDLWNTVPNLEVLTDDMIRFRCDLHRQWANKEYMKNPFPFPEEKYLTASGERVRSRGEVIIYDRLDYFGVPHRFDQLINLNDGNSASPDFSFEDRNYEEFYLEYCGMMDNPEYVRGHLIKRNRYEASGIVPWKNICYIYSTDSGISVPEIDSVIMNFIIPRL